MSCCNALYSTLHFQPVKKHLLADSNINHQKEYFSSYIDNCKLNSSQRFPFTKSPCQGFFLLIYFHILIAFSWMDLQAEHIFFVLLFIIDYINFLLYNNSKIEFFTFVHTFSSKGGKKGARLGACLTTKYIALSFQLDFLLPLYDSHR